MTDPIILCADGSELATKALVAGRALLRPDLTPVIVTVIESSDPMLVTGTGMAGGTMSNEEYDALEQSLAAEGADILAAAAEALALPDAERRVVRGDPGGALCDLAEEIDAHAIVMGSRGRGGIKRAFLGSVSDHVIRHAPCPVIVTGHPDD